MDCDTTGIEPAYSLVAYKNLAGGGTMVLTNQTVPLALQTLGYNTGFSKDINPILDYVKEKGTIRGAPRVQPEHYPVFDCANDISPEGHLLMMAAVQPFLSGAISKTINLAQNTTVAQVAETYYNGWKYGLKAVALYRDGSKVSAPLLTKAGFDREAGADGKMYTEADLVAAVAEAKNEVRQELLAQTPGLQRQERKKLPAKRTGTTHELVIAGQKMYLRTGEYEDGSLGEVFIDMHKEGAAFRSMMNCFAIAISKGLQYGVPLEEFIETFAHTRFEPAGPVQGHPNLKMAGSVVDAVFRILGHDYLGISELVQNPDQTRDDAGTTLPLTLSQNGHTPMSGHHPWKELRDKVLADPERAANVERIGAEMDKELVAVATKPRIALSQDAPMCHECGHLTTRNGTCFKCNNCGATTGCS
jgi:ribonucleoside-diphosphate reductase alpha chain